MKHKVCIVDISTTRRVVEIDTKCPGCGQGLEIRGNLKVASLFPVLQRTRLADDEDCGFSSHCLSTEPNEHDPCIHGLGYHCASCGYALVEGGWIAE